MCPVCWMTAFASISMFVAISGAVIAMRDRCSLGIAAILGALSATSALQPTGFAPQLMAIVGCLLAARVAWVVAAGPNRILWDELWVRAKVRAASLCPAKKMIAQKDSGAQEQRAAHSELACEP